MSGPKEPETMDETGEERFDDDDNDDDEDDIQTEYDRIVECQ